MTIRECFLRFLFTIALFISTTCYADEWESYGRQQVPYTWTAFPLQEVRLLPGSPFYDAMMHHRDYILSLDPDRLLTHRFEYAGLKPKKPTYQGWEGSVGFNHGHYLSSLSLYYAATGDPEFLYRIQYTLGEMKKCSDANPGKWCIYEEFWKSLNELRDGSILLNHSDDAKQPWNFNGASNSWYIVHKTLAGLRDAVLYAHQELALEIARPIMDSISSMMLASNRDLEQSMLAVEQGGMLEVMTDFYVLTGIRNYLDAARRFNHINVIYPTAAGENVITYRHANDQIPKFVGAAREYVYTANDVYGNAARNFWDVVVHHHTLANGGNSCYERFGHPDQETKRLDSTPAETCNTYNMLKLTRTLFMLSGNTEYADYAEWALYNHILASLDPCHPGAVTYYTALRPGDYKQYSTPFDSFWCCVGTGMENHAKYGENLFFHNDNDLLVSLYASAHLEWREKGLSLQMDTRMPESDTVKIRILHKGSFDGKVYLRCPAWAQGTQLRGARRMDNYLVLDKVKAGQEYDLVLPRKLYVRQANDDRHYGSVCYGPLLLAADLGTDGMNEIPGDIHSDAPMRHFPSLVGSLEQLDTWIRQDAQPLHFLAPTDDGTTLAFKPYYQCHHHRFSAYWNIYSPQEYEQRKQAFTDRVLVGDNSDEVAHSLIGTNHQLVSHNYFCFGQQPSRQATDGGEFSYTVRIRPGEERPYNLICTYWGDEPETSQFEVLVDDQHLMNVNLHRLDHTTFVDDTYPIPTVLTRGKSQVKVTFRAKSGFTAGPLFDLRITADTDYR